MADVGFHEGGVRKKILQTTPTFGQKTTPLNNTPGVELGVCLRFSLAACSLEVVYMYTGKIAITVDTKIRAWQLTAIIIQVVYE